MAVDEKQLKDALNAFGDFQHQREYLKAQKQELINKIIPPEIQMELAELEEEFEGKDKIVAEKEKSARKVLDMMLEQYAGTLALGDDDKVKLNSDLAYATIEKGDIVWNPTALDAYAISGHPEILSFRKEEKPKIRVTRKKM